MGAPILNLPNAFDDLGIDFSVARGRLEKLGSFDPATGAITIAEGLPALGEVCVLVHEMMHAAEGSMLADGQIAEEIDHGFIHGAAFGITIALARCGAIKCTEADIEAFFQHAVELEMAR